jgi:hypothetical protein
MHIQQQVSPKVSEIAAHFKLGQETTRKLLRAADVRPVASRPDRYSWDDIWRLEGAGYVPTGLVDEFQIPLLKPAEVSNRFFPHLAPRTITDRAKKGLLPGILLGNDWRFRERDMREAAIYG